MASRKAFLIRIDPDLLEELNRWAAQEFRSVNGQIEFLLQRAVDERRIGWRGGTEREKPSGE
ncbi:MAG: Arc family DNA-binding protein [Candidatus Eisenbacteria bacterium]|nr:Arc family DNA-binding protein [Candidatus Eisenbacteria bacterium]